MARCEALRLALHAVAKLQKKEPFGAALTGPFPGIALAWRRSISQRSWATRPAQSPGLGEAGQRPEDKTKIPAADFSKQEPQLRADLGPNPYMRTLHSSMTRSCWKDTAFVLRSVRAVRDGAGDPAAQAAAKRAMPGTPE